MNELFSFRCRISASIWSYEKPRIAHLKFKFENQIIINNRPSMLPDNDPFSF